MRSDIFSPITLRDEFDRLTQVSRRLNWLHRGQLLRNFVRNSRLNVFRVLRFNPAIGVCEKFSPEQI